MRWFESTMGSMSPSDAAPLPRQGEVFFDVRGSARSMRLSWYADTGVAVFSIWQAGTCTGTFRLPMTDLPRMIATLNAGPAPRPADAPFEAPGRPAHYGAEDDGAYPARTGAYPAARDPYPADDGACSPAAAGYPARETYPAADPGRTGYPGHETGYPEPDFRRDPVAARPDGHWEERDPHYLPAPCPDSHPGPDPRSPFTGERSRPFVQDYVRAFPGMRTGTFAGPPSPDIRPEPMPAFAAEAAPAQSGRAGGYDAGAGRTGPAASPGPANAVYPGYNGDAVLEPGERAGESPRYGDPAPYEGRSSGR
jgi:hypothetical protein